MHNHLIGGGFGRRLMSDYAAEQAEQLPAEQPVARVRQVLAATDEAAVEGFDGADEGQGRQVVPPGGEAGVRAVREDRMVAGDEEVVVAVLVAQVLELQQEVRRALQVVFARVAERLLVGEPPLRVEGDEGDAVGQLDGRGAGEAVVGQEGVAAAQVGLDEGLLPRERVEISASRLIAAGEGAPIRPDKAKTILCRALSVPYGADP